VNLIWRLRRVLLLVLLVLLIVGLLAPLPPRSITIESGPEGGTWHQAALKFRDYLEPEGIKVYIRTNNATLAIVNDVDDPSSDIDVSFAVQPVDTARFPNITTLGSTEYQPLFVFYRASFGQITSLSALRGARLILPPQNSATTAAALPLLRAFGVTPNDTTITYHPLSELVAPLLSGQADAAFVMLAAGSPVIRELALRDDLRIMDFPQAKAIERTFPSLHATVLPRASYSLSPEMPAADIRLVAATSDVAVRKQLHPAIAYLLLQAMSDEYSKGDLTSSEGEFPAPRNRQIPLNKNADNYYRGGLPWAYRVLPVWLASIIGFYIVLIIPIAVLLPVYNWLNLPGGDEIYAKVQRYVWLLTLRAIERRLDAGVPLLHSHKRALALIVLALQAEVAENPCEQVVERIKTKLENAEQVPA